jgi:hypothetical protein
MVALGAKDTCAKSLFDACLLIFEKKNADIYLEYLCFLSDAWYKITCLNV